MWTGCCIGTEERIGILAVVVKGGYHCIAKYQWQYNDIDMKQEIYPVLYAAKTGSYSCMVTLYSGTFTFNFRIQLQGIIDSFYSLRLIL